MPYNNDTKAELQQSLGNTQHGEVCCGVYDGERYNVCFFFSKTRNI